VSASASSRALTTRVVYLVGEIYVPLFVTAVQNAIDYNLRPYLMAPLLLMAYLPLYAAAWCGMPARLPMPEAARVSECADMAGLAASAFVAHCRLSRSYGTRCPPWLVHAILFLPPLIACSYLVIVFALMGVQLRLEADAWQAVDAALAIDEAAWRPETSLLAVFGTLAELQEPAATLGEQYDASVTYMRIVLGSLAGNLLVICAVWLPAAVFGLVKARRLAGVLVDACYADRPAAHEAAPRPQVGAIGRHACLALAAAGEPQYDGEEDLLYLPVLALTAPRCRGGARSARAAARPAVLDPVCGCAGLHFHVRALASLWRGAIERDPHRCVYTIYFGRAHRRALSSHRVDAPPSELRCRSFVRRSQS
jgi:hypothetical protein